MGPQKAVQQRSKGAMSNRSSAAMPECAQTSSEAGVQKCSPPTVPQRPQAAVSQCSPPAVPASAKAAVLRCPACLWKISQSTAFTIYYYLFITFYPYHLMALKKTYKALLKYILV